MQKLISLCYKALRRAIQFIESLFDKIFCKFIMYFNNIHIKDFKTNGIPYISVARGASCSIGKGFKMINNISSNPIGRNQKCILFVDCGANLMIGENVGISATALVCHSSITIGNNVKIGGGVCIYDTDFHSLDSQLRINPALDIINKLKEPVVIGDNAFIGAHSTILKGVNIGDNVIVGACSVVTKSIPANEIWGGNPAKFLKKI